jgi:hypothetical protein
MKSIFVTYLISITSLLEDEQTCKHGGGGRYNAILEFKGEQMKKIDEKEKEKMRKRKKEKEKSEYKEKNEKRKNMRMCKNKIK